MSHEKIYLLTDGCLWEINKQTGNEHPHSVEVVDLKTGAVRYIKSGSRIKFIDGEITDIRTQKAYNKVSSKISGQMSSDSKDKSDRDGGKRASRKKQVPLQ